MTVAQLGEQATLARVTAVLATVPSRTGSVLVGIGDDAAVVTPRRNSQMVLTTDAQIEHVHFDTRFSSAADIGYRALAVNLSDLAAMGATPAWALLSLALPGTLAVEQLDGLVAGVADAARAHGCAVVGGNLTRSPGPLMVDITAAGEARPRRVLLRGGGQAGDALYVSGHIGGAGAGLEMLRDAIDAGHSPADDNVCIARYRRPQPRVRLGRAVAEARAARAAMDLSDGLADAARQVADASGCGVDIVADALPIEPDALAWWTARDEDSVLRALTAGDDYELLFAVPRRFDGRLRHVQSRVSDPALTRIGVLTRARGEHILLRDGERLPLPGGFTHWAHS